MTEVAEPNRTMPWISAAPPDRARGCHSCRYLGHHRGATYEAADGTPMARRTCVWGESRVFPSWLHFEGYTLQLRHVRADLANAPDHQPTWEGMACRAWEAPP